MKAIDTNILVRILVDDKSHAGQMKLARQFAMNAGQIYIPQIVQVELVRVLQSAYDVGKRDIISILSHLQENEVFVLQNENQFAHALHQFQESNADFSDCLIWAECKEQKLTITTFDKKFSRLPQVDLLTTS